MQSQARMNMAQDTYSCVVDIPRYLEGSLSAVLLCTEERQLYLWKENARFVGVLAGKDLLSSCYSD